MRGPRPSPAGYGAHIYIPWWKTDHGQLDFRWATTWKWAEGGFAVPNLDSARPPTPTAKATACRKRGTIRDAYGMGTMISLSGRGSCVPNENSYCEIDPDGTKDKWGIPVLRFHWKWSDYEPNQARHMRENFTAILETLGGTINTPAPA
jgi:hypothetical protein